MCWCNPQLRTPNCGRPGCHPNPKKDTSSVKTTVVIEAKDTRTTADLLNEIAKMVQAGATKLNVNRDTPGKEYVYTLRTENKS